MAAEVEESRTPSEWRLLIASDSPRRREIVRALDVSVEAVSPDLDEGAPRTGETAAQYVLRLSQEKAVKGAQTAGGAIVLGADTVVVLNGHVLGKPVDKDEAARMLRRLRGREHEVVTGVTVLDSRSGRHLSATRRTGVAMREYLDDEIAIYVASGEPLDKAGGYAIQDARFRPVQSINGCYLNVVGLPLCEVIALLEELGTRVKLRRDWRTFGGCQDCSLEAAGGPDNS